jgi:hypothetical protein
MTSPITTLRTPYEERLDLVSKIIGTNSALDGAAADDLAVHILHALNSIPEKVR